MRRYVALLALLVSFGCAPTPVQVDVTFPREENFLFSEFGQLFVYEVDSMTGLGTCPTLLEQVVRDPGSPVFSTELTPICEFRAGGVSFDDIPPGPHAYVVTATDDADALLLAGCTVAEAYEGAPPIEVRLFPTDDYAAATQGRMLTCASANDKCSVGCR